MRTTSPLQLPPANKLSATWVWSRVNDINWQRDQRDRGVAGRDEGEDDGGDGYDDGADVNQRD